MMKSHIKNVSKRMGLGGEITDEVKKIAMEEFEMTIERIRTCTNDVVIEKQGNILQEHSIRYLPNS